MNPNTGHLVEILGDEPLPDELARRGYREIPPELAAEAEMALAGRSETYVDLDALSPLSQWAADQRRRKARKKARARAKRKAAKRKGRSKTQKGKR